MKELKDELISAINRALIAKELAGRPEQWCADTVGEWSLLATALEDLFVGVQAIIDNHCVARVHE